MSDGISVVWFMLEVMYKKNVLLYIEYRRKLILSIFEQIHSTKMQFFVN